MHNPYSPPEARVEDVQVVKGSGVKAVTIGVLVDIGGSTLAGILLTMIYGVYLMASGVSEDKLMEAIFNMPHDSLIGMVGVLVGCLFSVLGGYVCARIARHSEYKFGLIASCISVIFGFVVSMGAYSLPMNLALSFVTFGSVMLGIQLGVSKNRAPQQPRPAP